MDRREMKKLILYAALNSYETKLLKRHKEGRHYLMALHLDLDVNEEITPATESRYMYVLYQMKQNAKRKLDS